MLKDYEKFLKLDQSAAATGESKNKVKVRKEIIAFSWLVVFFS